MDVDIEAAVPGYCGERADRAPPTRGKGTLPPVWSEVVCVCTFFQPGFSGVQAVHERGSP